MSLEGVDILLVDDEQDALVMIREALEAAVAVTSYARLDDRSRALAAGFKAHVSKPIDPTAFVKALASAVSQPG